MDTLNYSDGGEDKSDGGEQKEGRLRINDGIGFNEPKRLQRYSIQRFPYFDRIQRVRNSAAEDPYDSRSQHSADPFDSDENDDQDPFTTMEKKRY